MPPGHPGGEERRDPEETVVVVPVSRLSEIPITVPSSKSHTIRALLIAGAADGPSEIRNALDSADARSCITALESLGVSVEILRRHATGLDLAVTPPPGGMLAAAAESTRSPAHIDVGNSGTTLYLLTALAALRPGGVCFDGDASIRRRSARKLLDALAELGARIDVEAEGCAPYCVTGPLLPGRTVAVESPTSQYLSAILLAAPLIPASLLHDAPDEAPPHPDPPDGARPQPGGSGDVLPPVTTITVPLLNEHPYVDMTCWWLDRQQIAYSRDDYKTFTIPAGQSYRPVDATLPGDYSSATFWFCAAAITGRSVTVAGLLPDDVQGDRQVLDILADLGCTVSWSDRSVTVTGPLHRGGRFDLNAIPDALPALSVAACYAPEAIILANVPQARQKETDRIAVMASIITALGGTVRELPDGLEIEPGVLRGGTVSSSGDHRIAMACAIAALGATGPITITDAGAAAVTYPSFFDDLVTLAPASVRRR
ncbi:MAG: 3-phosphoshikimate 1-carboxyvinyltransferase [Alkalispirochaeta sp.]